MAPRDENRKSLKYLKAQKEKHKKGKIDVEFDFSDVDMDRDFQSLNMPDKFLGRFSLTEIKDYLLETGVMERLLGLGYINLHYRIDMRAENDHRLYIYSHKPDQDKMLVHLRVRHDLFTLSDEEPLDAPLEGCRLLLIDWLRLQNPKQKFRPGKLPYPGQYYPGLGLMDPMSKFISILASKLGLTGVFNVPEYFHDAMLFTRFFRFLRPESEGKFLAIRRDLRHIGLRVLSQAIHDNFLVDKKTGKVVPWDLGEQICPIKEPLVSYFSSKEYKKKVQQAMEKSSFDLRIQEKINPTDTGDTGDTNPANNADNTDDLNNNIIKKV